MVRSAIQPVRHSVEILGDVPGTCDYCSKLAFNQMNLKISFFHSQPIIRNAFETQCIAIALPPLWSRCDKRKPTTVMIRIYTVLCVQLLRSILLLLFSIPCATIDLRIVLGHRSSLVLLDIRIGQDALCLEPPAGLLKGPGLDAVH